MACERTGRGQEVTGSLVATALGMTNAVLIEQAIAKPDRVPQGNLGYASAPADLLRCRDGGWLIVQAVGQPLWMRFCRMLGAPEWLTDPRFKDDAARGAHNHVVSERLRAWCRARDRTQALQEFENARIPAAPVHSPQEALDDPLLREGGFFRLLEFPGMAFPAPLADTPIGLSDTPGGIRGRAPLLSEHTEDILREIGYAEGEIRELQAAGIV